MRVNSYVKFQDADSKDQHFVYGQIAAFVPSEKFAFVEEKIFKAGKGGLKTKVKHYKIKTSDLIEIPPELWNPPVVEEKDDNEE